MRRYRAMRLVNFVLTSAGLAAGAGALMALILITTRHASLSQGETRSAVVRLAWLATALLALCLLMLTWVIARYARERLHIERERTKTPYVDAWAEAGRRLKLSEEQNDEEQQNGES